MAQENTRIKKKAKSHWYTLEKENFVLFLSLIGGMLVVTLICFLTPARKYTITPLAAAVGIKSKPKALKPGEQINEDDSWIGTYQLGDVVLALGTRDEYIDSEISLEYDGGALSIPSQGEVTGPESANKFLKSYEGKIKDAIVMQSSDFSYARIKGQEGVEGLKNTLTEAINNAVSSEANAIRNVYFKRFLLFSDEME